MGGGSRIKSRTSKSKTSRSDSFDILEKEQIRAVGEPRNSHKGSLNFTKKEVEAAEQVQLVQSSAKSGVEDRLNHLEEEKEMCSERIINKKDSSTNLEGPEGVDGQQIAIMNMEMVKICDQLTFNSGLQQYSKLINPELLYTPIASWDRILKKRVLSAISGIRNGL